MRFGLRLPGFALLAACGAVMAPARSLPAGMVLIPAGKYESPYQAANGPKSIPVDEFYLDALPVTNADFLAFVRGEPKWRRSQVSPLFADTGYLGNWKGDLELGAGAPPDSPVVLVSWFAARAYARWRGCRLPTTAEWERAAAAGFTTEAGARDPAYRKAVLAWFASPAPTPLPAVGSGRANIYGAKDLIDLAWEWVDDFNSALLAGASGSDSPLDRNLFCAASGAGVRSFSDYPAFMRMGFRSSLRASYVMPNLGFRCALSP
jgi:formylglycine-generating enzyme required for sulfatase activity